MNTFNAIDISVCLNWQCLCDQVS